MIIPIRRSLNGCPAVARLLRYTEQEGITPRRCIEAGSRAGIYCYIPACIGAKSARAEFFGEGGGFIVSIDGEWRARARERGEDIYFISVPNAVADSVGLYFFNVGIKSFLGDLHLEQTDDAELVRISGGEDADRYRFQVLVSKFSNPPPPKRLLGGIVYHIFVDRFKSTGKYIGARDDVAILDWNKDHPEIPEQNGGHIENNTFFGGDLDGIAEKLDYIASLGVNCLYLSPVFEAYSNHKYDTGDYMKVDPMFGGDEALERLIEQAKKKGISVVLDGVFNHTGSDSVYFNRRSRYGASDPGAYNSKDSIYSDWYNFFEFPNSYECWWGIDTLPRLNLGYPPCRDFFVGRGGVVEKYMAMGAVGFRLDVADELSDDFIESLKRASCRGRRRSVIWGEVWEDASNKIAYGERKGYFLGSELDGVMNYPLRRGILDFFSEKGVASLRYAVNTVGFNCPKRIADYQLNFLGTHDTERVLTALSGVDQYGLSPSEKAKFRLSHDDRKISVKRLKAAYLTLAFMPGIPSVFYGDEAGVEGFGDPFCRKPFPWGSEDKELTEYYSAVGRFRRSESILKDAEVRLLRADDRHLVISRDSSGESLVLVVNVSKFPLTVASHAACLAFSIENGEDLGEGNGVVARLGTLDAAVFRLKRTGDGQNTLAVTWE